MARWNLANVYIPMVAGKDIGELFRPRDDSEFTGHYDILTSRQHVYCGGLINLLYLV
jgi:hypothetical protein